MTQQKLFNMSLLTIQWSNICEYVYVDFFVYNFPLLVFV